MDDQPVSRVDRTLQIKPVPYEQRRERDVKPLRDGGKVVALPDDVDTFFSGCHELFNKTPEAIMEVF